MEEYVSFKSARGASLAKQRVSCMLDSSVSCPDGKMLYVPPFPSRPKVKGSLFKLIWAARKNLLGVWPDHTFESDNFLVRVLRRRILFVTMPDTVKQVFVDGRATYETKSHQLRHALAPLIGDGLFISDGDTWRKRRRLIAPITHVSRLPDLTPPISAAVAALRSELLVKHGVEIDAIATMADLTVDIIVQGIFGRELSRDATRRLVVAFGNYREAADQTDLLSLLNLSPKLPRVRGLRTLLSARAIHRVLNPLIDEVLDCKEAGRQNPTSIMAAMARNVAESESQQLTRRELRNEAAVMILAGHEGAGNTLAWALFLVSQDPATERQLHVEVDSVLGDRVAVFEDFANLPFTRAVVEETMRLYPPIPFQARIASQDGLVGGRSIKTGDLIILNAWIMQRHRKLWSNPDAFDPHRFMPSGSGVPSRYAYVPFSIGPRVCTGAAFAILEMVLCLATITRSMRLRLRPGWTVTPECRLSLRPGTQLPMIIERRDHALQADPT